MTPGSAWTPAMLPGRFAAKIQVDENGCWIFTGCTNSRGYGCIAHDGKVQLTHRVSYTLLVAPIPAGLQIDHLCRVRRCCNPGHIEPVSQTENQLRSPLTPMGRTDCKYGHPLSGDNLYIIPSGPKAGRRICRACKERTAAAYNARRRRDYAAEYASRQAGAA